MPGRMCVCVHACTSVCACVYMCVFVRERKGERVRLLLRDVVFRLSYLFVSVAASHTHTWNTSGETMALSLLLKRRLN